MRQSQNRMIHTSKMEQRNDFISTTTHIRRILYHPNRPHSRYHSYSAMLQEIMKATKILTKPKNFNAFDLLEPPIRPLKYDNYMVALLKWEEQFNKLKTEKQPNIHQLENFFKQPPYYFNTIFHSFKLKYRALTTEPNVIEKTMTPWQLYSCNSPHWTNELTAEEADAILMHTVGTYKLNESEFNNRYHKAITGELPKKPLDLHMYW